MRQPDEQTSARVDGKAVRQINLLTRKQIGRQAGGRASRQGNLSAVRKTYILTYAIEGMRTLRLKF